MALVGDILQLRDGPRTPLQKRRERGFYNRSQKVPLPVYDPIRDQNLDHFWENPRVKRNVDEIGYLDPEGKVLDIDKFRRKSAVIRFELQLAQKIEQDRLRDIETQLTIEEKMALRQKENCKRLRDILKIKEHRLQLREQFERRRAQAGFRHSSLPPSMTR